MAYHFPSDEADQLYDALSQDSGAALIHVYASEQQAPGALQRCPVCGQPYTSEDLVGLSRRPSTTPDERLVLYCAACGTYSVGLPAAQSETGSP
jgi:hypothetical protein